MNENTSYRVYYYKWTDRQSERLVVANTIPFHGTPFQYYTANGNTVVLDNEGKYRDGKATGIQYYFDGKYHRDNHPAIIYQDITAVIRKWYSHGLLHKSDGPAWTENHNGAVATATWYYDGIEITEEMHDEFHQINLPENYDKWTTSERVWLKMKYGGLK